MVEALTLVPFLSLGIFVLIGTGSVVVGIINLVEWWRR